MVKVQRIVLDVLKPHVPNGLEFTTALAKSCPGCHFKLQVIEVDENTETVMLEISGDAVLYDKVSEVINSIGGSIHSIDEVEVININSDSTETDA